MGNYDLPAWLLVVGNIPLVLAAGWMTFGSWSNAWDSACACLRQFLLFGYWQDVDIRTNSQDDGSIGQMVLFVSGLGVLAFVEWKVLF